MINSYCNKLKIDINFLLQCSTTNPENLNNIKLPLFYREIISCFNESKSELDYEKISSQNLLLQPIWNNSKLLYKGNPFFLTIGSNREFYILQTFLIGMDVLNRSMNS